MKILLLNYEFPPLGGGSGKASLCILQEFAKAYPDLIVDVVCSSEGRYQEQEISSNIKVWKLDIGKKGNIQYQSARDLITFVIKACWFVRKLLKREAYDLAHCFFAVPTGVIGYLNHKRIPYLVSLRGSDVPGSGKRFKLGYPVLKPAIKCVCKNAAYVVANSNGLKNFALQSMPDIEIEVIPNGIDVSRYKPSFENVDGPLQILYVGRLIQSKGLICLLEAFARFRKSQEAVLHIAGDGRMKEELQQKAHSLDISSSVIFHGHVQADTLIRLYQQTDVFVLPSKYEGMSNALLEAMASGLPVIVTDTGGTEELVKDNGRIINSGDIAALHNALVEMENNREYLAQMGKQSRTIAQQFTWKNTAEEYYKLYRAVCK